MLTAILKLLTGGTAGEVFKGWMESRTRIQEAKINIQLEQIKQAGEADKAAINDWGHSWKDEFVLIVWFAPIIMCFIPYTQDYVRVGFQMLSANVPSWYVNTLMGIVASVMAIRGLKGYFNLK